MMVYSGNILKVNMLMIKQKSEAYTLKANLLKTSKKRKNQTNPFCSFDTENLYGQILE